eukprot:TRINITY_DN78117_c0_g1_i1.p1 TRINITY_DN78117_c0_g1~~TRINITY_DN78117_c0_g1_i1.p1  ORF type:complete len:130 (-),score=15.28 TRINITY_DN78117_c0_g1_i1:53-442(-)
MSQSSRTPYDHLRYRYPETWKRLVKIMDKEGAPVALSPSGEGMMRTVGGFRIEGSHLGPSSPASESSSMTRTMSDPAFQRWKQEEKANIHTLRLLKNTKRNPFGGWYEGSKIIEKIGGVAATDPSISGP